MWRFSIIRASDGSVIKKHIYKKIKKQNQSESLTISLEIGFWNYVVSCQGSIFYILRLNWRKITLISAGKLFFNHGPIKRLFLIHLEMYWISSDLSWVLCLGDRQSCSKILKTSFFEICGARFISSKTWKIYVVDGLQQIDELLFPLKLS